MTPGAEGEDDRSLETRAQGGDVDAMRALAFRLHDSDREKAVLWWRTAAEVGDRRSMYNLALAVRGDDPEEAQRWLREAAVLGDRAAMCDLGDLLEDEDLQEAERWWRRAADAYLEGPAAADDAEMVSTYNLGVTFRESDPATAIRLLSAVVSAAEREGEDDIVRDAALNLVGLLSDSDPDRSAAYLTRAAELGDTRAMDQLAAVADEQGDEAGARRWLERALESGDGWAAHRLARMTFESDPVEARRLCEAAAERGDTAAKASLGKLLFRQDRRSAWRWIEQAAEEGDGWAIGMLAHRFLRRHPTSQSRRSKHHSELMDLLRRGSEKGDPYSMFTYGHRLAAEGQDEQAAVWLAKAAEANVDPAKHLLTVFDYNNELTGPDHTGPLDWVRFVDSFVRYRRRNRSK